MRLDVLSAAWDHESSRMAHGASMRRWAPQTTRDTPNREQKSNINEIEMPFLLAQLRPCSL